MKRLRIGIIDLLYDMPPSDSGYQIYRNQLRRQFVSIMPQVISVWCRQLGHDVFYTTYYGQAEPHTLLPEDLDFIFVSSYTQASILAYALARIFKKRGVTTVIGGPHARAFPDDCLRFFDHVVQMCDQNTLNDILNGHSEPGTISNANSTLITIPGVEERMPELMSTSLNARLAVLKVVPILSSIGCPYTCNFCSDADSTYHAFDADALQNDLRFVAKHIRGAYVVYHDPNFGVRFDETMQAIESLEPHEQPTYGVQSTLSVLKESRVKRLSETGCDYLAPGVESWADFSNKSGKTSLSGREKLERVVSHMEMMRQYVPGYQVNFVFGTDADQGPDPVDLTCEFARRVPYAWTAVSIPTPFGDTGIFNDYLQQDRILKQMPFMLYYKPYLNFIPLHYSPLEYYEGLIKILSTLVSLRSVVSRLTTRNLWRVKGIHMVQLSGMANDLKHVRHIYQLMKENTELRAFHEGQSKILPDYYKKRMSARMGKYSELFTAQDLVPVLINNSCRSSTAVNVSIEADSFGEAVLSTA